MSDKLKTLRFHSAGLRALAFGVVEEGTQNTFGISELILDTVEDLSESDAQAQIKEFARSIDDSVFVREEWLDSLETLLQWLKANNKRASFADAVGYIACVAESQVRASVLPPLRSTLKQFLADNGFERAK